MSGLSGIPGGRKMRPGGLTPPLPRNTKVGGQPHHLAYITREEAGVLRSRGGGADRDGRQIYGPGQVPAYRDESAGDAGNADSGASDSGAADGGATDGSPAADGTGAYGGGTASNATDGSPAADGTGAYGGGAPTGSTGPADPSAAGRGGLAGLAETHDRAMAGKYGSTAQAGVVGATVAGGLAGAAMAGLSGLAEGIGGVIGRGVDALGGTPSTDSSVGEGPTGGGSPTASDDTTASGIDDSDTGGSGGSRPPAFPAGWDEATFLAAHPDVARSVSDGTWESGYAFNRAWKKFAGQDYGVAPADGRARNAYAYRDDFTATPRDGVMPHRGYFPDYPGPYG